MSRSMVPKRGPPSPRSTGTRVMMRRLDEPRLQKPLNSYTTVDVKVVGTTFSKSRDDLTRRPGHLFNNATADRGHVDGTATQDHYALVTIWPSLKGQNLLESLATDHKRIDACYELVVAVGFAAALRQPVEIAVWPRDEAVDAGADKDRYRHRTSSIEPKFRFQP